MSLAASLKSYNKRQGNAVVKGKQEIDNIISEAWALPNGRATPLRRPLIKPAEKPVLCEQVAGIPNAGSSGRTGIRCVNITVGSVTLHQR